MWKDPEPDPGGNSQKETSGGQSSRELSDLKDQNEQQQLLISQLKEMLRKERSSVTQEKVEEYVNTLSKVKAKRTRIRREESGSSERTSNVNIDVNKKEKINLLKQQLEENKARLAERGKNQKGIEEMVIQLKAQFNDSQQLINSTPLNLFLSESRNIEYDKNTPQEELYNVLMIKERKLTELVSRNQKQEATILDLRENLKEKDSVIDARTKAITLMTDSLSKKGKDTLDALDDTKEQMRKMQENFVTLESEMKARQMKLLNDLKAKNLEITELQENNQKLLEERDKYLCAINDKTREKASCADNKTEELITELQLQLKQSNLENQENVLKITDLEEKLQSTLEDMDRLKSVGLPVTTCENVDSEVSKLKKQLDESNKNMIKIKAQSKSKIKELTKKIDAFKKASDVNALIVQLQTENTKLSEKIAELEEEKGNMQLKMVESTDSTKESTQLDEYKILEEKLITNSEELEKKDKVISSLESDIISLREEIQTLNEKISSFSLLQNVQVTSEMKSIQIEEELDKAESEKLTLKMELERVLKENNEMAERIDVLSKEKQEISAKLDNYIQENMELIDKLEKLSAEKVSSAESIEIVEGLTQQEKLELAAYQKNVDVNVEDEPVKSTEEDNIEPTPELNETVLQLNEDSTELLQKIDMFNMERKEVMSKLEALKEENNHLNLRINEIENNRDILAETYEQLQTEKEQIQNENEKLLKELEKLSSEKIEQDSFAAETVNAEVDALKKLQELQIKYEQLFIENEEMKQNLKDLDKVIHEADAFERLQELQIKYDELFTENEEMKHNLKDFDTVIQEKNKLESDLLEYKRIIDEFETKQNFNLEEIKNYRAIVDENKGELINSSNIINQLQSKLHEKENDVKDLNIIINDLNEVVNNLQNENVKLTNFELVEAQVNDLKMALQDQIQQAQEYEEEIARNNDINNDLSIKLTDMNRKIIETEHEMEMKDIEAKNLLQILHDKEEIIKELQTKLEEKDKKISIIAEEMKEKYLTLQKQLEGNNGSMEKKVEELTNKNKEQLEKMKKIAANLKKKTQAYKELEEKYNGEKEKWETEANEKESLLANSREKISSLLQQLKELEEELNIKSLKCEEAENKLKKLAGTIQELEEDKVELNNLIVELERKQKLNEVNLKQELTTSLHEEFDNISNDKNSAYEEKIRELELIIETNQTDLKHYKERLQKLEEAVSRSIEERDIFEIKCLELENDLKINLKKLEEKSLLKEKLEEQLSQLSANTEALSKNINTATEENKELTQKNSEIENINHKLKIKLTKAHEKVTQLKSLQNDMEELESANRELKKQLANSEAIQKHIQVENEALQKQNQNDYEKIEADYQIQLEELIKCKTDLTVECEKLQETLKETQEKEVELLSEIAEYKQKNYEHDQKINQIQQLSEELNTINTNWKDSLSEINSLKQQIEILQKELVTTTAKETVEHIISEAQEQVINRNSVGSQTEITEVKNEGHDIEKLTVLQNTQNIPTFHWPGSQQSNQTQDWFAAHNPEQTIPQQSSSWFDPHNEAISYISNIEVGEIPIEMNRQNPLPVMDNSKEELLNKIKTLEFLLYNVDKEKEEALKECTGMVNELTHLVYEKVNATVSESSRPQTTSVPTSISNIESQILSNEDIVDAAANKKELKEIEYEKTDPSFGQQRLPIVEDMIQPKHAYLTYKEDKIPSNMQLEAFVENDDGWAWGPEEVKLEEEYLHNAENTPLVQKLKDEVAQLSEKLQVLQVERENHLEEIKQLQIKSGKLIKKCKELKQQNQLMLQQPSDKSEGADFFNLDETIQEELKMQITQLEKRIKEITGDLDRERVEKANILKRVDILTSANEKMLDMKEIQETEILHWKRKHQEVEEKLQQYEWGGDGFDEGVKSKPTVENASSSNANEKVEELQQMIKELCLDNEELQALLDEQRQLRINAEKAKNLPNISKTEEEHNKLSELYNQIKQLEQEIFAKEEEIATIFTEKNSIASINADLQKTIFEKEQFIQELQNNLKILTERNQELESFLTDKDKVIKDLQENEKISIMQQTLTNQIDELEQDLSQLRECKIQQQALLNEKDAALSEMTTAFNQTSHLKEELGNQITQLTANLEQQVANYELLQNEMAETARHLQSELDQEKQKYDQLQADIDSKINELQEQTCKNEQLQNENYEKKLEIERLSQELSAKQRETTTDTFELSQQKYELENTLSQKEYAINELKSKLTELDNQKILLEDEIKQLKINLEEQQTNFKKLSKEMDEKIARAVADVEQTWEAQVNQRGADVAESWKLHLEAVERDFATIEEKLKYEINELEEKCNALVNENNELRKNVDAEIRNEVDRISAMQQQISDRQQYINELNNVLGKNQKENDTLNSSLITIKNENEQIKNDIEEKDSKISSLNIIVETTRQQFNEKREVVEEIVGILEKHTSWPLSYEKQDILNEFQRQLNVVLEKEQEIVTLNERLGELQKQIQLNEEKNAEVFHLNQIIEDLQKQLHEKDKEVSNLNWSIQGLQEQYNILREKEEENLALQRVIEEYKMQQNQNQQELYKLNQEKNNTVLAVEDYKQKLEEFKLTHIALQNSLDEKNQLIVTLNQQLQFIESDKSTSNKDIENMQTKIDQLKQDSSMLQGSLSECQQQLFIVNEELTNKINELSNVQQQLAYSQQNVEIQEMEINRLKELLQAQEREYSGAVENLRHTQLRELENHYEEVIAAKELDVQSIRAQLNESTQNIQMLYEKINTEENLKQQLEITIKQLDQQVIELTSLREEETKQLTEMKGIIEEQVVKIEELKKELFDKSNDYDSLIAEMDIGRKTITQQPTSSVTEQPTSAAVARSSQEEDLSEPVSRAELDLALYMLHQRDVRCEELTVELTQLLEERDTLQLRLSNAIREKEDIRKKLTDTEQTPSTSSLGALTSPSKSSAIFLAASGTELATEPLESSSSDVSLANKLSELKRVGYKKDKTFVDEQTLRQLQQMSIMQQHINEASKLPPEAAAKLVDASYTLSRDVQSPSKVLLNWLWGRSTPKVNDS